MRSRSNESTVLLLAFASIDGYPLDAEVRHVAKSKKSTSDAVDGQDAFTRVFSMFLIDADSRCHDSRAHRQLVHIDDGVDRTAVETSEQKSRSIAKQLYGKFPFNSSSQRPFLFL